MQTAPPGHLEPPAHHHGEAERQLADAAARHREVVASLGELGRPAAGQHVAAKAVARAVQLVTFALHQAEQAGVPAARLAQITGWDPDLVRAALEHSPEPHYVGRLAPAGIEADAVVHATASLEAASRLRTLAERILDDVRADDWTPAPADLDDLRERVEHEWRVWRRALGRVQDPAV